MNKTRASILLGILLLFSSSALLFANATTTPNQNSLSSGYAITNNYQGKDVPLGTSVNVTAMTTNCDVNFVTFIWKNAAGVIVYQEDVYVHTNGTRYNGQLVKYASSVQVANSLGDWTVIGKFYDEHGFWFWTCDDLLATRSTSFNVVPEVPLLGTAGIAAAMALGFTVYKKKKQ
jgi:hypothetical protein